MNGQSAIMLTGSKTLGGHHIYFSSTLKDVHRSLMTVVGTSVKTT